MRAGKRFFRALGSGAAFMQCERDPAGGGIYFRESNLGGDRNDIFQ